MRIYFMLMVFIAVNSSVYAQYSLKGNVQSVGSIPVEGAFITINGRQAVTNKQGNYTFGTILAQGSYTLTVSSVGYKQLDTVIAITENTVANFLLKPDVTQLKEITLITGNISGRDKTALSTQTVNSSYIRRNIGGSLMQSLENIGGISTIAIGSGQSKPIIRGLGFNRVVVTEGGIKHEGQQWGADHGLEIDQYAVGRVKVVKGPASLLYGSDAVGGLIEIEKPMPPDANSFGGSVDFTGKSNNNLFGSSLNLYGRRDKLFFDARITGIDYADYKVPTDYINIYSYKAPLYKNRLRNTAGNELNLHFTAGYVSDNFQTAFYFSNLHTKSGLFANAHGLEPRNVDTVLHDASDRDIQNPYQDVNHFKVINRMAIYAGMHTIEIDLGYQNNYRQEFSDYISHGSMPPVYPDYMQIPETLEREFSKNVYSLNARDNFETGKHALTVGINAEHQNNNSGGWGFILPDYTQHSAGIFAYDKITLSDELFLHIGARYDYGTIKTGEYFDWFTTTIDNTPQNLQRAVALQRTFNSPSWAVGITYHPGKWAFRANAGQSFRMPIAKELASNGVNYHQFSYEKGNAGLSAEKSYQLDLGAAFENKNVTVEASPFINYFPNYIYLNPTPAYDYAYGAGNQIFNYTQSRVLRYGGELNAKYTFAQHYTLSFVGEYVYSEQKSGPKKGFTLPFSPPPTALFSFTYSKDFKALQGFYAGVDYKLVGDQNNIVPPENKTPGYQLINLSLGGSIPFNKQVITLNIQVQNLLNASNLNHTSFYRIIGVPEPGRNIVVTAKIPFSFR